MDDERKLSEQSQEDFDRIKDSASDASDLAEKAIKRARNNSQNNNRSKQNGSTLNDNANKNKAGNSSGEESQLNKSDGNGNSVEAPNKNELTSGKGKNVKASSVNSGGGVAGGSGDAAGAVAGESAATGTTSAAAGEAAGSAGAGAGAGAGGAVESASVAAAPESGGTSLIVGAVVALGKYILIAFIVIALVITLILTYIKSYPQILWTQMFGDGTSYSSMQYWEQDKDWEKEEKENGTKIHKHILETAEELGEQAQDHIDEGEDTNLYDYDFYNDAKTLSAMSMLVEDVYMNYKLDTMDDDGFVEDDGSVANSGKEKTKTIENENSNSWFKNLFDKVKDKYNLVKQKVSNAITLIKFADYQKKVSNAYKTKEVLKKIKKLKDKNGNYIELFDYTGNYIGKKNKKGKYIALSEDKKTELFSAMLDNRFKKEPDEIKKYYKDHYCNSSEIKGSVEALNMILENLGNKGEQHYYVEDDTELDFYGAKELPKAVKKHEKLILKGINAYLSELKKTNPKKYEVYSKYNKKALLRLMEAIAVAESGGVNSNLMGINPAYLPSGVSGDDLRFWSAKKSASILLRMLTYVKVDKDLSDIEKVKIVVQAYNFTGENYIDWLNKNYKGKQTQKAIDAYIATVYPAGASNYLKVVMPYYYTPTKWTYPVPSCHDISCGFYGYANHNGVDFSNGGVYGKPIVAAAAGKVIRVRHLDYSYGYHIYIYHEGSKITTQYCHMSKTVAKEGQRVLQGQVIGYVGSTGNSTGPHCHFGMFNEKGVFLNPMNYLPK